MNASYFWSLIIYSALLMLTFVCLYYVERRKHILYWSGFWLLNTLSLIILSFENTSSHFTIWNTIENIIGIFAIWAIVKGSIEFFQGRYVKFVTILSLSLAVYYIIICFIKIPLAFYFVPRLIFSGLLLIYTGVVSIRIAYVRSVTRYILGVCFLLWGACDLLDILGYVLGPSIFYTLFMVVGLFSTATAIVIQMLYFQKSRDTHKRINDEMKYLMMNDSLTCVYNRGYCETEMSRLDREDQLPISIILGDLNCLKLINDTFGHRKGDQVLVSAASIMKSAAPGHIVGRWGGDEFIIVMPKTSMDQAMEISNRIKDTCSKYKDGNVPLDISLGTAVKEKTEQSFDEIIETADNMLYKNKLAESKLTRNSITDYLKSMLLEKNIETEEHVLRMKEIAYLVAQHLGLSDKEREDLALVAFMHDIGKISIPDNILNKPGKLTPDEWEIMKKHSSIGYRITMASDEFVHISQSVLSHHERWDGKGYPLGLKGDDIPLLARIISIIDAFDAMTHARVYKDAVSVEDALREIERCSGTQFDPVITGIFVRIVRETQLGADIRDLSAIEQA